MSISVLLCLYMDIMSRYRKCYIQMLSMRASKMKKISFVGLISLMLSACIVGPYRSELYEEIEGTRSYVGKNEFHFYIVDGSKYEGDEAKPPYRIGIWLLQNETVFEKVAINEIRVSLNGKTVEGVDFKYIRSGDEVDFSGSVKNINPAPCCGFMLISNALPVAHVAGDQLDVFISVTTGSSSRSSASISYKATIKRGIIRWVTVV